MPNLQEHARYETFWPAITQTPQIPWTGETPMQCLHGGGDGKGERAPGSIPEEQSILQMLPSFTRGALPIVTILLWTEQMARFRRARITRRQKAFGQFTTKTSVVVQSLGPKCKGRKEKGIASVLMGQTRNSHSVQTSKRQCKFPVRRVSRRLVYFEVPFRRTWH